MILVFALMIVSILCSMLYIKYRSRKSTIVSLSEKDLCRPIRPSFHNTNYTSEAVYIGNAEYKAIRYATAKDLYDYIDTDDNAYGNPSVLSSHMREVSIHVWDKYPDMERDLQSDTLEMMVFPRGIQMDFTKGVVPLIISIPRFVFVNLSLNEGRITALTIDLLLDEDVLTTGTLATMRFETILQCINRGKLFGEAITFPVGALCNSDNAVEPSSQLSTLH